MSCFRCKGIHHCPQRKHFLKQRRKKHCSASVCEKFLDKCPCSECLVKPVCFTLLDSRYHGFCSSYKRVDLDVIKCKARDDFTIDFNRTFKTDY